MSTRSAIATSVTGRYVTLSLQFVSTLILARLLTPEDIGIYSAGFSIVALAHLFRDFGLNQYLIQEKNLDKDKIHTTFTLSLLISWSLGAIIYLFSGIAAEFFREPGVEKLLRLLAFNFLIIPFGSVTLALLRKNLKFHITAVIGFFAALTGVVTAIWSAYDGARYMCLAYGAIAETGTVVLLSMFFRPDKLTFGLGLKGIKSILKFGSIVGLGNVINQFSTSFTDAIVARILGLSALGFFSRAFGTFSLFDHIFVSSIRPTILPLFSRNNHDPEKLTHGYLQAVSYSFVFAWPFFGFLFMYTDELMRALYGTQWGAAVPLVKVLCSAGIFLPAILFIDNLFVACGKPEVTLKIQALSSSIKLVLVATACFIDLHAVCLAIVAFLFSKTLISLYFGQKILGLKIMDVILVARQAVPCLFMALTASYIADLLLKSHIENVILKIAILAIFTFLGWIAGLISNRHPLCGELRLLLNRFTGVRSS